MCSILILQRGLKVLFLLYSNILFMVHGMIFDFDGKTNCQKLSFNLYQFKIQQVYLCNYF